MIEQRWGTGSMGAVFTHHYRCLFSWVANQFTGGGHQGEPVSDFSFDFQEKFEGSLLHKSRGICLITRKDNT